MSDANDKTLESYEAHAKEYVAGTNHDVGGVLKEWLDASVAGFGTDARILEIGSAFGRDADYLESLGYSVERSDAAQSFVSMLKEKGASARLLNVITEEIGGPYDLVFADAVLLHFTPEETALVLSKVFHALGDGGRFSFTVKEGNGEEWSEEKIGAPRYFCYWTEDTLRPLIEAAGFTRVSVRNDQKTSKATWLQVIASKE